MATDPFAALLRADARYRRARSAYEAATDTRREAIVAAAHSGMALKDIASALEVTHEAVRKTVREAEVAAAT